MMTMTTSTKTTRYTGLPCRATDFKWNDERAWRAWERKRAKGKMDKIISFKTNNQYMLSTYVALWKINFFHWKIVERVSISKTALSHSNAFLHYNDFSSIFILYIQMRGARITFKLICIFSTCKTPPVVIALSLVHTHTGTQNSVLKHIYATQLTSYPKNMHWFGCRPRCQVPLYNGKLFNSKHDFVESLNFWVKWSYTQHQVCLWLDRSFFLWSGRLAGRILFAGIVLCVCVCVRAKVCSKLTGLFIFLRSHYVNEGKKAPKHTALRVTSKW